MIMSGLGAVSRRLASGTGRQVPLAPVVGCCIPASCSDRPALAAQRRGAAVASLGRLPAAAVGAPVHLAWVQVVAGAGGLLLAAAAAGRPAEARCDEPAPARRFRRVVVTKEADFPDGEVRQIKVKRSPDGYFQEATIMLARVDGRFYATGASCSHYSAALAEGVVAKDKMYVVCPWHNAAFDIRTGEPVRGPGLQAIPTYAVDVEFGNVMVELPDIMEDFVDAPMARRNPEDTRLFAIVGGGPAAVAAADTLRQEGFTGRIVILTEERHLPYDRPVLSKNLSKAAEPEALSLRDGKYFESHDIEVRLGCTVTSVDGGAKTLLLSGGEELRYDCALVATGAKPLKPPVPGANLPGVMVMRNPEDAVRIGSACGAGRRVVIVGSSFIGMEVAATLKRAGSEVTVIGMESEPFERILGKEVGASMKAFFASKGVQFIGNSTVTEIQQAGDGFKVALKSGQALPCDAVVCGVGVAPNAGFVQGVEKASNGALLTNEFMQTSAEGLFAAGDVATYRSPQDGELVHVEHWEMATSQGRAAARSMVGKQSTFDQAPFFWTSVFGKNLRYVGYCPNFDNVVFEGDVQKLNFVAYYCQGNSVKAVATMGRDPVAVAAGELMRMGRMPSRDDLKSGKVKAADFAQDLKRLSRAGA